MSRNADQNRFLGALLGMAIGDALGMPVAGWNAERIRERVGAIDDYRRRVFDDGAEIKAGEFTDESEIALCIVESATANGGLLDPDLIAPRMSFLARGESKRWMHADTLAAIRRSDETLDFVVPVDEDGPATGDVAVRGVPVGLLHAVGPMSEDALKQDAEIVTRVTHGSPKAIASVSAVAYGVMLAARQIADGPALARETAAMLGSGSIASALERIGTGEIASLDAAIAAFGDGDDAAAVVATGFAAAIGALTIEEAVFPAVNAGGAADSRGAIAG